MSWAESAIGAAAVGVPVLIADWGRWADGSFRWLLVGAGLSLLSFVITVACNVPPNRALDGLDVSAATTERAWVGYVASWTRWNTARTVASAASVPAYLLSMRGR